MPNDNPDPLRHNRNVRHWPETPIPTNSASAAAPSGISHRR